MMEKGPNYLEMYEKLEFQMPVTTMAATECGCTFFVEQKNLLGQQTSALVANHQFQMF
jgi:hypothetical protein